MPKRFLQRTNCYAASRNVLLKEICKSFAFLFPTDNSNCAKLEWTMDLCSTNNYQDSEHSTSDRTVLTSRLAAKINENNQSKRTLMGPRLAKWFTQQLHIDRAIKSPKIFYIEGEGMNWSANEHNAASGNSSWRGFFPIWGGLDHTGNPLLLPKISSLKKHASKLCCSRILSAGNSFLIHSSNLRSLTLLHTFPLLKQIKTYWGSSFRNPSPLWLPHEGLKIGCSHIW